MKCYLDSNIKENCFGCEACKNICPKKAIVMEEDIEGFRYPKVNHDKCINCNLCKKVCPYSKVDEIKYNFKHYAWGGYNKDENILNDSTSGGAFFAIVNSYCDNNYVIFGAKSEGLSVKHDYITDKNKINLFQKSKYSQSIIGDSYITAKKFLEEGKKVLFSGTPCQIAGLKFFLRNKEYDNLLTIEVVCEGVPSPLFIRKYNNYIHQKYKFNIKNIDYRYKDKCNFLFQKQGKWDFQVMKTELENGKVLKIDRWFNPFWSIWLNHLMSRPSCYNCQFTTNKRVADITLGDLWGVHIYCKNLYNKNKGSSLIIANSPKGKKALDEMKKHMIGNELNYDEALKYQSPLKKSISSNIRRDEFMSDLENDKIDYKKICQRWHKKPTIKLLWSKYIWGNRQKMFLYDLKNRRNNEKK